MGGAESKPWRKISLLPNGEAWKPEVENELRVKCVKGPDNAHNLGSNLLKILVFGSSQHGKSSLVNSMLCAMTNRINQYVLACKSHLSFTRSLYSPDVRVDGQPLKFKLTDMPGIFRGMGKHTEEYLNAVLGGHIKEDEIVPDGPLDESAAYYIRDPQPFDLPCCVMLVMRAGRDLDEDTKGKLQLVTNAAERVRLKVAVVLTHVDNLEGANGAAIKGKSVAYMFHEEVVRKAVEKASNDTGIPISYIHPVVNYSHEVETTTEMNILHLFTLSKILDLAAEGANSRRR